MAVTENEELSPYLLGISPVVRHIDNVDTPSIYAFSLGKMHVDLGPAFFTFVLNLSLSFQMSWCLDPVQHPSTSKQPKQ